MSKSLNRRDLLKSAGLAGTALLASPLLQWAAAADNKTRKILFFTRSQGFEHSAIKRNTPETLSYAEKWLVNLGKKHNMEVTCTKDGAVFTEQGLAPFDVIMFYTTGELEKPLPGNSKNQPDNKMPMPANGQETLLKAISGGKGFLGVHSATDTWDHLRGKGANYVDPYIEMIGGEFVVHGKQQDASIKAVTHEWGDIKDLQTFTKFEEWYILKNLAPDMQVLLLQETGSMSEQRYKDLAPYPETWARMHGKGRVFYTSMGHREDVWDSDVFHKVLLGGLQWTCGNVEAEVKPNLLQVAPGAPRRAVGPA
jgi:type 1 glutamine amidotransferase